MRFSKIHINTLKDLTHGASQHHLIIGQLFHPDQNHTHPQRNFFTFHYPTEKRESRSIITSSQLHNPLKMMEYD